MKILILSTAIAVASATLAFADGHRGNSDNARAMAENIKTFSGRTATALRPGSGSDFEQSPGNTGWGNAGSAATGAGLVGADYAEGGQVSGFGRNK